MLNEFMAQEDPAESGFPPGQMVPRRILVVEDDSDIRFINSTRLAGAGYHVDTAENGSVAWDALQKNHYDLIITDNDMPEMTGIQLLIKMYEAGRQVPIIMATGTLPTEIFTKSPWLQPTVSLQKPYTSEQLLNAVTEALAGSKRVPGPTPDQIKAHNYI